MKQICLRAKLAAVTEKYRGIDIYTIVTLMPPQMTIKYFYKSMDRATVLKICVCKQMHVLVIFFL